MTLCALCATRDASYVCHNCGRAACGNCFDPTQWRCTGCGDVLGKQEPVISSRLPMAIWLFFVAFAMISVGMFLMALGLGGNMSGIRGGAVILIGPIPIILGSGSYSVLTIVLAAVVTVLAVIVFLRKFR